jgi:hypothetical protein
MFGIRCSYKAQKSRVGHLWIKWNGIGDKKTFDVSEQSNEILLVLNWVNDYSMMNSSLNP